MRGILGTACAVRAARRARAARSASAAVARHAPSSTTSFMRNAPAGCVRDSAPGVEKRNESVVRKVPTPASEPTAETVGAMGRAAMARPVAISIVPITFEAPCTPRTRGSQERKGLFSTSGRIPSASNAKNFAAPIATSRNTTP